MSIWTTLFKGVGERRRSPATAFRPRLEALDDRLVPDASPTTPPLTPPAQTTVQLELPANDPTPPTSPAGNQITPPVVPPLNPPSQSPGSPGSAPVDPPIDPSLAEKPKPDPIDISEKEGGDFRKKFLETLAKKEADLPEGWEAHHIYLASLEAVWKKLEVGWDKAVNGRGVPGTVNRELYVLYTDWLAKYCGGDTAKIEKADFDKFNKAIDDVYGEFMVMPDSTPAVVAQKYINWIAAVNPGLVKNGKIVETPVITDTDLANWTKTYTKRRDAVWAKIK